jgi:hypothetical protein
VGVRYFYLTDVKGGKALKKQREARGFFVKLKRKEMI